MAEQRQTFRFRLPWLSAPRPTVEIESSVQEPTATQTPAQPTITIAGQRLPFRPVRITPQQAEPPQRVQSQPSSPSLPTTRPRVDSQPTTPSRTIPRFPASARSPKISQTAPPPPSPSYNAIQFRPTATVTRPVSPPKRIQITTQKGSSSPPKPTEPEPPVTQREPQGPQPKTGIKPEIPRTVQPKILNGRVSPREKAAQTLAPVTKKLVPQPQISYSHQKDKSSVSESHQKPATANGERVPLHKEIRDDISKFVRKMVTDHSKKQYLMEDKPLSVITIAGDNKGASLYLGSHSAEGEEEAIHIHKGFKIKPDYSTEATNDGDGKKQKAKEAPATSAYLNSNVQSVNNSIVFEGSITERNPGVDLVLSHDAESLDSLGAEFFTDPTKKLVYESSQEEVPESPVHGTK